MFWPALQGFWLSLTNWDGLSAPEFVGFGNFHDMVSDPIFRTALKNTAIWLVLFGGLSVAGGFGMALLLQKERRGVGIYRAALFTPVVFSLVVTALIWRVFYQPDGLVDSVLRGVGLGNFDPALARGSRHRPVRRDPARVVAADRLRDGAVPGRPEGGRPCALRGRADGRCVRLAAAPGTSRSRS